MRLEDEPSRVHRHRRPNDNYFKWIAADKEIVKSVLLLTGSMEGTKAQVMEYIETFTRFDFLYMDDLQAAYTAFMNTNPSLEAFENELKKYMDIEKQIQSIAPVHNIGAMSSGDAAVEVLPQGGGCGVEIAVCEEHALSG